MPTPTALKFQGVFKAETDEESESAFHLDTDDEGLSDKKTTSMGEVSDQGKGVGDNARVEPGGGVTPGDKETTFDRCTHQRSNKKRTLQTTEGF